MTIEAIEELAELLYERYCESVGGKAWNGDDLPDWHDFSRDPEKVTQAEGWRSVAREAWEHFEGMGAGNL